MFTGIVPVRLLCPKSTFLRVSIPNNCFGIDPVNELCVILMYVNFPSSPISDGMLFVRDDT